MNIKPSRLQDFSVNHSRVQSPEGPNVLEQMPRGIFTPQDEGWKPVNRAQFAQVVFGGKSQEDELREAGER